MRVKNIKKEHLQTFENSFKVLLEMPRSKSGVDLIAETLNECFDSEFNVYVVEMSPENPLFVMSIFPERSTIDKIIDSVVNSQSSYETIKSLWGKNKRWTIELDGGILRGAGDVRLNEKELTAALLHEIGHFIQNNSIPERLITILQYEYAKSSMKEKMMLRDKIFRSILALPILDSCIADHKEGSVKKEIAADTFVKKLGYTQPLISAMNKILKNERYQESDRNKSMAGTMGFSMETLRQIEDRKANLVKDNLMTLRECVNSPYIESVIVDIYGQWFIDPSEVGPISNTDLYYRESVKERYVHNRIKESSERYMKEFGIFGVKKLEKIEPYQIDYIDTKIGSIRTDNDKLMLLSYVHSKLDMVQFYMDILMDPIESKKYRVPHTMGYLKSTKDILEKQRDRILRTRTNNDLQMAYLSVNYPSGYEG